MNQQPEPTLTPRREPEGHRKEILLPVTAILLLFIIGIGAVVWLALTHPLVLQKFSDLLMVVLFVVLAILAYLFFVLNLFLSELINGLRSDIPEKFDLANEKIATVEPVIIDTLNKLTKPMIELYGAWKAVAGVLRKKSHPKNDHEGAPKTEDTETT